MHKPQTHNSVVAAENTLESQHLTRWREGGRGGKRQVNKTEREMGEAVGREKWEREGERMTPPHISSQSFYPFGLSDSTTELNELLH